MPRAKKQVLKKRKDGRFACRYKDQWFYSLVSSDDALEQRQDYIDELKRGRIMSYFVKEYALQWFERAYPNISPSTKRGLNTHLLKLINAIGEKPVSEVKPSDIKAIYSAEYKNLSNSYVKAGKQLFCALFDSAVADGLILSNPARDKTAKPHKGTVGGHRAITEQERNWIETLCTDHRGHAIAMTMLYSGLRPQEVKALNLDTDVDFDREIITVRETAHNDPQNGQKYVFTGKGKTDRANRQVPLLPPLKAALCDKHGYLVTSAHGDRINHTTWRVLWNSYRTQMETAINGIDRRWYGRTKEHKAIIAAGGKLPEWIPFTVTPYDLRHSFVTMCRSMKPPIEIHTVIAWMGHADAKMILSVYDSVTDDRDKAEAERLKDVFKI
jgi:integrase